MKKVKLTIYDLQRIYELYGNESDFDEFLYNLCNENIISVKQLSLLSRYYNNIMNGGK